MRASILVITFTLTGFAICYAFGENLSQRGTDLGFSIIQSLLCGVLGFFVNGLIGSVNKLKEKK